MHAHRSQPALRRELCTSGCHRTGVRRDAERTGGDEVFEGTIVGEGPIGDGACTQKSYEIQPSDAARARVWIHFERCGDAGPSPAAGGLGTPARGC